MQTIKDVNTQSNSTSAVQPISFDSADQVENQLRRLEQRLDIHVQAASQGKNRAYAEQLTAVIRESLLDQLAQVVHNNVSVKGVAWEDYLAQTAESTQPLDSALLKDTIGTQDAAFQISSVNSVKRIVKTPQLASQVDTRVRRVVRSGDDKATMLEQQRTKRESRIRMRGGDIANLTDLSNDIQSAEGELARDAILSKDLSNKAERAATVSADIESIRASSKT